MTKTQGVVSSPTTNPDLSSQAAKATGPATKPTASLRHTAVWQQNKTAQQRIDDVSYEEYRARYDLLWGQGWRLEVLQPTVAPGNKIRYSAVWTPSTAGEIQVYGWTYEDYRKKYDELWKQGWRLKIIQPYVLAGDQVRYDAVWTPSTAGEFQLYGATYGDYRKRYDELWKQDWRLKLLQPYVMSGDQVRYTAVWHQSTAGEFQLYGATYADYRKRYDELWKQGWRLKLLQPYVVSSNQVRYTAVWQQSTAAEIQLYDTTYVDFAARSDELSKQGWRLSLLRTMAVRPAPPKIRVPKPTADQLRQRVIDAYRADGGLASAVGYPAGAVQVTADQAVWPMSGGRVVAGARGAATVEIDQKVRVWFVGFKCFDESSELSSSDEPYFIVSYVHAGKAVTQSHDFSKINKGQTKLVGALMGDDFDVKPARLHVAVYESDEGKISEARRKVANTMSEIAQAGAQAAALYNVATSAQGAAGDGGLSKYTAIAGGVLGGPLGAALGKGVVGALGLGDDYVGDEGVPVFDLNYDQIKPKGHLDGPSGPIPWTHKFWIDSDSDGDYEVYFRVEKMDVPRSTPSLS